MKRTFYRLIAAFALWTSSVVANAGPASIACTGSIPNFVTDICWSCVFPLKIMGDISLYAGGQEDSSTMSRQPVCNCGLDFGFPVSFWEPSRMADVTVVPYCMTNLGGITIPIGMNANMLGGSSHVNTVESGESAGGQEVGQTSFWQVHWYINPLFVVLDLISQSNCLETKGFDLAYMSEIDPSHYLPEFENLLSPDSYLFANVLAQAACAADCIAASVGFPIKQLYWCAGCNGPIFPLTGEVSAHSDDIQATSLVLQRVAAKLHRIGTQWSATGTAGLCRAYPQVFMDKTNYKYSVLNPVAQTTKILGRCCQPFGRSTLLFGAGKVVPGRPNYGYQIYRKRDCCQGVYKPQ